MYRKFLAIVAATALTSTALGAAAITSAAATGPTQFAAAKPTLVIRVSGLSKGVPARIQVTGPHHYSVKLTASRTLRGVLSGTYRISVAATSAPHGSKIYPASAVLTAKITHTAGATAAVRYVTVVPGTTKTVSAKQISRVRKAGSHTVVYFGHRTALKVGNVLATGVGPSTPNGLIGKVTAVASNGAVTVAPTTLLQALPQGQLTATAVLTSSNMTPAARRAGLQVADDGTIKKKVDGPIGTCSSKVTGTVSGSISIRPTFHLTASWNLLHGVTAAQLTADITESSEFKASVDAAGSCKGSRKLFAKPVTFATFVVDVGPIPIVLQPQLQLTFDGKAGVKAAITTSASQSLTIGAGIQYNRTTGIHPIQTVRQTHTYDPPALTASGDVDVSVNPEINLLIDGVGGPEIGLTAGLELSADIDTNPWWTLQGYLTGNAGIAIPLLKVDKRVTLARKAWTIAHAPILATPAISVSPTDAYPWSDSVCGFHPGSTFPVDLEIAGSGFRPDEQVNLTTDWTNYGQVTADDSGNFDVNEPVGEVSGADHSDYGVYANGSAGSSASGSIGLNANDCGHIVSQSDGQVSFQWGANGDDADSDLTLLIDDEDTDFATTDDLGSGGSTTTFTCPDSGTFTWDVEGTDNGHGEGPVDGPLSGSCDPAAGDGAAHSTTAKHRPPAVVSAGTRS